MRKISPLARTDAAGRFLRHRLYAEHDMLANIAPTSPVVACLHPDDAWSRLKRASEAYKTHFRFVLDEFDAALARKSPSVHAYAVMASNIAGLHSSSAKSYAAFLSANDSAISQRIDAASGAEANSGRYLLPQVIRDDLAAQTVLGLVSTLHDLEKRANAIHDWRGMRREINRARRLLKIYFAAHHGENPPGLEPLPRGRTRRILRFEGGT